MKSTQGPSFGQLLIYDISSQRFGIFSLFLGIPSLGLLFYGLISKSYEYALIGLAGLLIAFWEFARLLWRFRSFQRIYENGETAKVTLEDVSTHGDEINLYGQYSYKKTVYPFSTTIQKNRRTKHLTEGDQINLVIDRDVPKNAYVQDLYTPDSPEEIRQTVREPSRPKLFWEPKSGYTGLEDPNEAEVINAIRAVYDGKAGYCILEIDKKNNLFMQIGKEGDPLEYCAGPDGPIYGVKGVSVEITIKCFLSYRKGDEEWKTLCPWEVHVESIKDLESDE